MKDTQGRNTDKWILKVSAPKCKYEQNGHDEGFKHLDTDIYRIYDRMLRYPISLKLLI